MATVLIWGKSLGSYLARMLGVQMSVSTYDGGGASRQYVVRGGN